jgi:hypothetical protein
MGIAVVRGDFGGVLGKGQSKIYEKWVSCFEE